MNWFSILLDFLFYFVVLNMGIMNEEIFGVKKREGKGRKGGGF